MRNRKGYNTERFRVLGDSPYEWERRAVDTLFSSVPDNDPFHGWALFTLSSPGDGRQYEIDALVIGWSAIYLVEIKSYPGRVEGDDREWAWIDARGRRHPKPAPHDSIDHKAKVLKSRLLDRMSGAVPWIQPLIFLSEPGVQLGLSAEGQRWVVTSDTIGQALRKYDFPGARPNHRHERLPAATVASLRHALTSLGLRPTREKRRAGSYELRDLLAETAAYQEFAAEHTQLADKRGRARVYLVPQQLEEADRQKLLAAAQRDASHLWEVREHPGIVALLDYVADAAPGPTLVFETFDGGVPLDLYLKAHPKLPFLTRLAILEQIGHALAHCHRRDVVHGALCPDAVLVRDGEDGRPEVKLRNFHLSGGRQFSPTSHRSLFRSDAADAYLAPELLGGSKKHTQAADIFGLGALAYLIFTNQAPASDGVALLNRLTRDDCLSPIAVADDLPAPLTYAIEQATQHSVGKRADSIRDWLDFVLAELRPATTQPVLDPRGARKGDVLGGRFTVEKVLGEGATARVLRVSAEGRSYALKVSKHAEGDDRLRAEGELLQLLPRHPHVVQCHEIFQLAERTCLLLSLAGDRTLQELLYDQGNLGIDLAQRYGDGLLDALVFLESKQILHRDIKPANLGVGTADKGAHQLTVFDFSLQSLGDSETASLDVGTRPYRDPFLVRRGRWDPAADRWSAAVVLHEMLTGQRPTWRARTGPAAVDESPLADGATLVLATERFDPAVRDRLTSFFMCAFAPVAGDRFRDSEAMRSAFAHACEVAAAPVREPAVDAATLDDLLKQVRPDTPLEALPLGLRARNALDRAGLVCAADLRDLPSNRLSAIRGIGTKVAEEIKRVRDAWVKLHPEPGPLSDSFFPDYGGDDLSIESVGLPPAVALALDRAGLTSLAEVARAPATQVDHLAQRAGFDVPILIGVLRAAHKTRSDHTNPTTRESWVAALLDGKGKEVSGLERLRRLFGLEQPFLGKYDLDIATLARHDNVTTAAIYLNLKKFRERVANHPAVDRLRELVARALREVGGVAPLAAAAESLRTLLPGDTTAPPEVQQARCAALIQAVIEAPGEDGPSCERIHERRWVALDRAVFAALRALGDAADALATRDVPAGPNEAMAVLLARVEGTPLAHLPQDRFLQLAADASKSAACSSRLELYRRDMSAGQALALTLLALSGELTPDEVRLRVRRRYPAAQELPPRPELDVLLAAHGLQWDDDLGRYRRPTSTALPTLVHTPATNNRQASAPDEIKADLFEERLRGAFAARKLRVLAVDLDLTDKAVVALERTLGVPVVALDQHIIAAMDAEARRLEVDPSAIPETDAAGPSGEQWDYLCELAATAADAVAAELLPPTRPLVVSQLGLLARYNLRALLQHLVDASRDEASAAIVLLVPCDDSHPFLIQHTLAIPGVQPGERERIPRRWIHRVAPSSA